MSPVTTALTLDDAACWQAVLARDAAFDGLFVYAVRTTGVFCRPSCPSRRPRRSSVLFFTTGAAAVDRGYRACKRCQVAPGTAAVAAARCASAYIARHVAEPLVLETLAKHVGLSRSHLQRVFTRTIGISPRAYHEALRARRFRNTLRRGSSVASAIYETGYGSVSRVYERKPTGEGVTPAAYRRGSPGIAVNYTIVECPLGRLLVAGTEKGVCAVKLGDRDQLLEAELLHEYPAATLVRGTPELEHAVSRILAHLDGTPHLDLPLDVRGTAFQWQVWQHLQSIPWGETRTYGEVARAIGRPSAVRAVAQACATNRVCLVVPCHRVIGADGRLTGFRWGIDRKRALLDREKRRG